MRSEVYHELIIKPSCDPQLLAEFVESVFDRGVEIGKDVLILTDEQSLEEVKKQIEDFCLGVGIGVEFAQEQKQNSDWIQRYKDSVQPIEVDKFYVHPSWNAPKKGSINIVIDPALSFGSGHHATTYSCLEAIGKYCKKDDTVLDIGCGSGILSIAAAKLDTAVDLCDSDEQAIDSAKSNFSLNNLTYNNAWVGSVDQATQQYDVVVANIIADVLLMLSQKIQATLKKEGVLILSGILDNKAQAVMDRYADLELIEKIEKDEWVTLVYRGVNEKLKQ